MKLASYKDGSRDGQLVVVSRDLKTAHYASGIATRLQQVLDDWNFMSPQLEHVYDTLNQGKLRHAFAFDPALCMAPLPRPAQWVTNLPQGADAPASRGPELLRALASTDPAQVPADRVTGDARLVSSARASATVVVPTDGGDVQVTLAAVGGSWEAQDIAPADAPPAAETPSLTRTTPGT